MKVNNLKEKDVLLLISELHISEKMTSALKEMYFDMKKKEDNMVEVVWIPNMRCIYSAEMWTEYNKGSRDVPRLVVPNPRMINCKYTFIYDRMIFHL